MTVKLPFRPEPVDLGESIEEVLRQLPQELLDKQHTLTVSLEERTLVYAEPPRLRQIINNLVRNAMLYTPPGGTIEIMAEQQSSFTWCAIRDNGVGIPKEEQTYIFKPLYRGWSPIVREYAKGSGLGLCITKSLIELMGGTIGFESEPDKGSTFWFTLPIAEPEIPANP